MKDGTSNPNQSNLEHLERLKRFKESKDKLGLTINKMTLLFTQVLRDFQVLRTILEKLNENETKED